MAELSSSVSDAHTPPRAALPFTTAESGVGAAGESSEEKTLLEALKRSDTAVRLARIKAESAAAELRTQEQVFHARAWRYLNYFRAQELWRQVR